MTQDRIVFDSSKLKGFPLQDLALLYQSKHRKEFFWNREVFSPGEEFFSWESHVDERQFHVKDVMAFVATTRWRGPKPNEYVGHMVKWIS